MKMAQSQREVARDISHGYRILSYGIETCFECEKGFQGRMATESTGSRERVAVICGGGHAKVVLDILRSEGLHDVVGVIDDFLPEGHVVLEPFAVLGTLRDVQNVFAKHSVTAAVVALGDNRKRKCLVDSLTESLPSIKFVRAIHPRATIGSGVIIGDGTVVMAGAVINCVSRIERHCIVNTMASVDHDCRVEDYASLAPRATLCGAVHVGSLAAVCAGAVVVQRVKIGEGAILGAASHARHDIPSYTVQYGNPAIHVRDLKS
jgi:sugar O-acyltransferase (sialic acid O-acetyltransferase NeuD family)